MINVNPVQSQISFTSDPTKVGWRIMHGLPKHVPAEYIGYTGPKNFKFPTEANLSMEHYPDITPQYQNLLTNIIDKTKQKFGKNKYLNFIKTCSTFVKHFKTADAWDTKYLEDFPGRTKEGRIQYTNLRGEVVSTNFVSNAIFMEAATNLGIKKWFAKLGARLDACGISDLISDGRIPAWKTLKSKDTEFDQQVLDLVYERQKSNTPLCGFSIAEIDNKKTPRTKFSVIAN